MTGLEEIAVWSQTALWAGFIVFLRVAACMSVMPAFGERTVPARIKLVLAMAFTLVTAPAVLQQIELPSLSMSSAVTFVVTETVAGLALGLALRLFVLALQTAGSIAAQSTSLAQIFGGASSEPMPAIGHILTISGLALMVISGLHVKAAQFLIFSYQILPAGLFPDAGALSEWGTGQIAKAFGLAFILSAPFVIMSALYNLTLGVINKAMPQLMVAFVGAPVITFGGLFMLFAIAPIMLAVWIKAFDGFFINPFAVP